MAILVPPHWWEESKIPLPSVDKQGSKMGILILLQRYYVGIDRLQASYIKLHRRGSK